MKGVPTSVQSGGSDNARENDVSASPAAGAAAQGLPGNGMADAQMERLIDNTARTAAQFVRSGNTEAAIRSLALTRDRLGFMPLAVLSGLLDICLAARREQEGAHHCLQFGREALAMGYEELGLQAIYAAMVLDAQGEYELTRDPKALCNVAELYEQVARRHQPQGVAAASVDASWRGPLRIGMMVPNLVDDVVAYTKQVLQFVRHADPERFRMHVYVSENSARRDAPLFPVGCTNPGSDVTGAETLRELNALNVPVFTAPRSLNFLAAAQLLARRLELDKIDVLILQTGIAFPIDWLAAFWAQVPVKVSMHIGSSLFLPGLDATFYDNPANIERESNVWEPEMGERLLLRQGTDIDALREQQPAERSRLGIPRDAVVIGTLSNHLRRRLSTQYLDTVASVMRECPNAWFVAFGDGAVPRAEEFFESRGLADRVRFPGKQTRVGEALKVLDVYANEFPVGGSQSVVEAMACGVPVVAMKWDDGHPESAGAEIVGGRYAIVRRDAASYAALLRHWVEAPASRKAASTEFRQRAERLFASRNYVTSLLEHAEDLHRGKEKGRRLPGSGPVLDKYDDEDVARLNTVRILHGVSRYDVFASWEQTLARELRNMGIDATVMSAHEEDVVEEEGCLGLGFNLCRKWVTPTAGNRHLAWLVDHPVYHVSLFMSEFSGMKVDKDACAVACVDEHWTEFGRDLYSFPHIFFAPHFYSGVGCVVPCDEQREYDVGFFGSIEEPFRYLHELKRSSGPLWPTLEEAIETYRTTRERPPLDEFLLQKFRGVSPEPVQVRIMMNAFFPPIDAYFRSLGRLWLLQNVRRTRVHVFGNGPWKRLAFTDNIVRHSSVSFSEASSIMARCRIVLNHTPAHAGGAHERIFEALGAGCLVHTTNSSYLARTFGKRAGISYFNSVDVEDMDDQLQALLKDDAAVDRVRAGQAIMAANHTARNRARLIADIYAQRWSAATRSEPRKPQPQPQSRP